MPLERIYIHEARHFIAVKSTKAIEKWCNANGIKIYIESGRKFLCRIEFLTAVEKPFIQTLKRTYGEKWIEVYHIMETNDTVELSKYPDAGQEPLKIQLTNYKRYKPKSPTAKRFIQGIINK